MAVCCTNQISCKDGQAAADTGRAVVCCLAAALIRGWASGILESLNTDLFALKAGSGLEFYYKITMHRIIYLQFI